MSAIKHVFTTVCFAVLSPVYMLYIVGLVIFSPLGLALAKPFHRTESNLHFSEYADKEIEYSLNEMFSFSGVKRVLSTIFFAAVSPLYILYIIALVFIAPIGFILSRFTSGHDASGSVTS